MNSEITPVREEDSFRVDRLHDWLSRAIPEVHGWPEVAQFRSGASNLTYLLAYPDRELILRCPPHGHKAASAHDMKREFLVQEKLRPHFSYVPQVLALCEDHEILGFDFYIMEKIDGTILRRDLPRELELTSAQISKIGSTFIDGLNELHNVDDSILNFLSKGPGYVQRQVAGWSRRYRESLTDDVPDGEDIISWLDKNQPPDIATCVIHGDWRLDNMVFDFQSEPQLVGVLDWELATVGDPLMDLGSSLAYWINADDEKSFAHLRRQPSHLAGMPSRQEIVEKYLGQSSLQCDDFTFYEAFGLFRLAVIAQQIWYRYRLGQTTNPHFAEFGEVVNILITRANGITS